jgi:two-component system KDP operon response regulator KdpE
VTLPALRAIAEKMRSHQRANSPLRSARHELLARQEVRHVHRIDVEALRGAELERQRGIRLLEEIIVLSARVQERTKIEALDAGADDYVTKPFAIGELLARIRAAMRHAVRTASGVTTLRIGEAVVDLQARTARRGDEDLRLTPIEFRLLALLARHLGMVVTHRQLLTEIWGPTHAGDTHYLRIYMKHLRDKFGDDAIRPRHFVTETGVGYRLVASD